MADLKRTSRSVDEIVNKFLEDTCNLPSELVRKIQAIRAFAEAFRLSLPMILTLIAEVHKICFERVKFSLLVHREDLERKKDPIFKRCQDLGPKAEIARLSQIIADEKREIEILRIRLREAEAEAEASRAMRASAYKQPSSTPFDELSLSTATFEELNLSNELLKGLYVGMKFHKPSKIQSFCLPMILTPPCKDLIVQAHNGSGKTTCFLLGLLSRVDPNLKKTQALCIFPTKELATHNLRVLRKMGRYTGITSGRDIPLKSEEIELFSQPSGSAQIVIGTPANIKNLVSSKKFSVANLKVVLFDKPDHMLAKDGSQDDSLELMKDIQRRNAQCKVLLFSSTFDETVSKFVAKTLKRSQSTL